MDLNLQPLVYIQLIGGVHGIFLTFILWRLPEKKIVDNKILGVLLLAISYLLLWGAIHDSHLIVAIPDLMGTGPAIALTFGPLLYFYVRATLIRDFKFSKIDFLHFAPALMFLISQLPFYLKSSNEKRRIILHHFNIAHFSPVNSEIPNIQLFIYLVVVIALLHRHAQSIKDFYSCTEQVRFDWLRHLTYAFTGIWVIFIVVLLFSGIHLAGSIMAILLAIFIYIIGYKGIRQPQIFTAKTVEHSPGKKTAENGKPKYAKSSLSDGSTDEYKQQVRELMVTDKIYRNSDLTLHDMADALDLSHHNLSQLLNEYLGTNFYDYINRYRVEEVKDDLLNPNKDHLTILAIAFDAGFKSKSTFYKTFKKEVGMTPSEFKRSYQE